MAKGKSDFQAVERTAPCSNCSSPVKLRRPSLSGVHFCAAKDCQAAKQRFYHRRRAAEAEHKAELDNGLQVDFLVALLARVATMPRMLCESCGREDAVDTIAHPTPDLAGACRALVKTSAPGNLGPRVVYAIWPEVQAVAEAQS